MSPLVILVRCSREALDSSSLFCKLQHRSQTLFHRPGCMRHCVSVSILKDNERDGSRREESREKCGTHNPMFCWIHNDHNESRFTLVSCPTSSIVAFASVVASFVFSIPTKPTSPCFIQKAPSNAKETKHDACPCMDHMGTPHSPTPRCTRKRAMKRAHGYCCHFSCQYTCQTHGCIAHLSEPYQSILDDIWNPTAHQP